MWSTSLSSKLSKSITDNKSLSSTAKSKPRSESESVESINSKSSTKLKGYMTVYGSIKSLNHSSNTSTTSKGTYEYGLRTEMKRSFLGSFTSTKMHDLENELTKFDNLLTEFRDKEYHQSYDNFEYAIKDLEFSVENIIDELKESYPDWSFEYRYENP
ncbi:uncharacterized protein L201_005828 [Kwoniella dendrophila CBS 6074]|uniref:Uncharacterized protein n=1 Tax=Kwoniella dendrophila CBS 6074 TaxID=1295534 RepID=A0AAX4K030_9TREE